MSIASGLLTLLSVILFSAGLYAFKKTRLSKIGISLFLVMAICSIILFIAYGVSHYFTGDGIDEVVIYTLKYGLKGAGFLEYKGLIAKTTALVLASIGLLWYILRNKDLKKRKSQKNLKKGKSQKDLKKSKTTLKENIDKGKYHTIKKVSPYFILSFSLLLNPAVLDIYKLQKGSLLYSFVDYDEDAYGQTAIDFYDYYRKPHIKKITGSRHKNVVLIYAESLERTYFDETLFPGLIKDLRELELESTHFTNVRKVGGTNWTIAGMTASQCGIPLVTPSGALSMNGMDQFLPSAVCLGDLLKEEGYHLSFMGGANLNFSGKGKLYKTHGFIDVSGVNELLPKLADKNYRTGWGLYDDSLLDMVYNRFIELSEIRKKFGLFALTLDTHHPDGHPSKSCQDMKYQDGSNSVLNAVLCSDYLITKLVKKIINSPYANDTIIVVVSDHLAQRNTAWDILSKGDRTNLFMILDASTNNVKEVPALGSTLDIGVTILPFLGYTGDIGFGRNLLSTVDTEEDRKYIHANLQKWRKKLTEFWDFPTIRNELEFNVSKGVVRIDERIFHMPILIELNEKLESILKFEFNRGPEHMTLLQHLNRLDEDKYFLLVHQCGLFKDIDKTLNGNAPCLLAGKGGEYTKLVKLNGNITYTIHEIREILGLPYQKTTYSVNETREPEILN